MGKGRDGVVFSQSLNIADVQRCGLARAHHDYIRLLYAACSMHISVHK